MRLLEKMSLKNGLTLEFWDESRKLAGDRWYVGLRACIEVPVPDELEGEDLKEALRTMNEALGGKVFYQHLMERHFVAEGEVMGALDGLKKAFLEHSLSYLSHFDFAKRFVMAKAGELKKRASWGPDYVRKALRELGPPEGRGTALDGTEAN